MKPLPDAARAATIRIAPPAPEGTAVSDGRLAQAVFWGLLALLAWAPLPFASNRPWSWSLLSLGVGVLLVLWALALARRPHLMRVPWHRCRLAGVPFLAAIVWALLQTTGLLPAAWNDPLWAEAARALRAPLEGAVSTDPTASVGGAMRLMAYAGVFWLAMQYGRDPVYARRIVWCIAIVGLAYAVYGLGAFTGGNGRILWYTRWAYHGDLTSTFVSRAGYGAFAGLGLLSALALLFRTVARHGAGGMARSSILRLIEVQPPAFYALVVACLTLATAVILSHSRGAVAVTALGVLVMLASLFLRDRHERGRLLIAAAFIAVAGLVVLDFSGGVTLGRVMLLAQQGTGREAIHALTIREIEAAPLTGHGLDTFAQRYFQYRDLSIPWHSPRYDKAHSTYLELAMELGLAGFALVMASLAIIVGGIVRGVVRRRRHALYPILGLAAAALIGIHSLMDFSVQMPAVAVTFAALLGVAFAQSWRTGRS